MGTPVACPLPELADALQPYLCTREEAAKIRHAIDLASFDDRPHGEPERLITRFTILDGDVPNNNAAFTDTGGVRSSYWSSLATNRAALARLRTLQSEIAKFQPGSNGPDPGNAADTIQLDGTLNAISSIRREHRRRRLQIIERSVNDLEKHRHQSQYLDVNRIVNDNKQPPPLPTWKTSHTPRAQDQVASHVLELEKAVLKAHSLARSETTSTQFNSGQGMDKTLSKNRHLWALGRARDGIASWLEGELAKVPDDSDPAALDVHAYDSETTGNRNFTEQQVHDAYSSYILARKNLVAFMNIAKPSDSAPQGTNVEPEGVTAATTRPSHQSSTCLAADVLPYSEELLAITEAEAALLQESAFVRRQMAWSSEKTRQLVHRLADESHLVAPAVVDVKEWVRAGMQVRKDDAEMVNARLSVGETSLRKARVAS